MTVLWRLVRAGTVAMAIGVSAAACGASGPAASGPPLSGYFSQTVRP